VTVTSAFAALRLSGITIEKSHLMSPTITPISQCRSTCVALPLIVVSICMDFGAEGQGRIKFDCNQILKRKGDRNISFGVVQRFSLNTSSPKLICFSSSLSFRFSSNFHLFHALVGSLDSVTCSTKNSTTAFPLPAACRS
jgi:hypothetical protein